MKLALRELIRRPGRFVTATLILTLIAVLLMFLGGLLDGLTRSATGAVRAQDADAIVYSDALGRNAWKPSPLPFKAVLQRLSLSGDEAIYVADNPAKDFRGARQVGMGTVRIRRPDGLHRNLEPRCPSDAPDVEITRLADLELTDWQSVLHQRYSRFRLGA